MSKRASHKLRATIVFAFSLVLLALLVPFSAMASGSAADATNGQTLYQANCASCHRADASGGVKVGSATSADIRWSAIGSTLKTPALVERAILQGKDETGAALDPAMPRFQGTLTTAQAADITAYLQTLTSGLPKTGDPIDGQALPWLALAAAALAFGGLKLRQTAR
ncbi:MAG TPA: cytochrome c [Chloroflexota bacterium]